MSSSIRLIHQGRDETWEGKVLPNGTWVAVTTERLYEPGRTGIDRHKTPEDAQAALAALVAERRAEGFVDAPPRSEPDEGDHGVSLANIGQLGSLTGILGRAIGLGRGGQGDGKRHPPLRWRLTAWALGLLGIVAGALGLYFYPPLDDLALMPALGAAVGVGLWLCCVVGALVCKRLGVHDYPVLRLFDSWTAIALLTLGLGTTAVLNGALDPRGLEDYGVVVISRRASSGGTHGGRSYGVKVADFRAGHEGQTLDLSVSEAMYRRIKKGDKLVLMAGRGLVDWWHSGVRMPDRGD